MIISSSTVSKYTTFSKQEIEHLVLNSYESHKNTWRLGEPPQLNAPLGILAGSLPKPLKNKLLAQKRFHPYLFWTFKGENCNPRQCLIQLKIKFQFDLIPYEFDKVISHKSRSDSERVFFQRKFNLLLYIYRIFEEKEFTQKEVFNALMSLNISWYKNYSSMNRFFSKKFKADDPSCIFHKERGKRREHRLSWTEDHVSIIRSLYEYGFDTQQITDQLKVQCEKEGLSVISRSTVKRIIKEKNLSVICAEGRLGTAYVKNNICGYIDRKKPDYKVQVVEADGSRLQLPYKVLDNSRWKVRYLTLYIIIDVASYKILGYSIDDFENKEMALLAFYMMFSKHHRLPAYLKIDRSSAHKSKRFERFLSEIGKKGVGYRFCFEPRDKGVVESFYHWFPEKICKLFDIYTGLSLVSKSWFTQANPDNVSKILSNTKRLPTRNELIQSIPSLANKWDNRYSPSINSTPASRYSILNYKDAKLIDEPFSAYLTWRIKTKNRFSRNTITHYYNGLKLSYRLSSSENIISIHGKQFTIAWLETELNKVYVFNDKNEFIEVALRKKKYLDDPINIESEDYYQMIEEKNSNFQLLKDIRKRVTALKRVVSEPEKELVQLNISSGIQSDKGLLMEVEEEFIETHYLQNKIDKKITDEIDSENSSSLFDKRFSKFKWENNE